MDIDTAIILAGGLGTRLRPLTDETPKPLLPLLGKPIIQHLIEQLKEHGVKKIILSIGYKADIIKNYFGDGSNIGIKIDYSVEDEPLGTGGAIKKAAKYLDNPFFLVWGDNLMDIDFLGLANKHNQSNSEITMVLTPVENVDQFGVAKIENEKITYFVEKPKPEEAPSNLINAGAFIVNPSALEILPNGRSSMERDCFEVLAKEGKISAFNHEGQWFATDNIERYTKACKEFKSKIDFSKKKVIIADVDETICETCTEISKEMSEQIDMMINNGYKFAFISGTHVKELQRMISSKLKNEHHHLGTTGTKYVLMEAGIGYEKYNYAFDNEEKKEIISAFEKLISEKNMISMTTKEDQLQDRDSQITLSPLGRGAPIELKKSYDPIGEKRKEYVKFLRNFIDEKKYEIKIGGTTSIDVTRKGLDKAWGIKRFAKEKGIELSEIVFLGDKIYPGGNDFAASKIVDCISVKNPKETLVKLKEIFGRKSLVDVRPWGKFEQYTHNEVSTVKILEVSEGKRNSLQSHENREELWIAIDDGVVSEINGCRRVLRAGEKVFISKNMKHRLSSENGNVRVLEISFGNFDEKDIVRYEDDHGRI